MSQREMCDSQSEERTIYSSLLKRVKTSCSVAHAVFLMDPGSNPFVPHFLQKGTRSSVIKEEVEQESPLIVDVASLFRPPGMPRMMPPHLSRPPDESLLEPQSSGGIEPTPDSGGVAADVCVSTDVVEPETVLSPSSGGMSLVLFCGGLPDSCDSQALQDILGSLVMCKSVW